MFEKQFYVSITDSIYSTSQTNSNGAFMKFIIFISCYHVIHIIIYHIYTYISLAREGIIYHYYHIIYHKEEQFD